MGIPTALVLPYGAITAIYGKESGLGMAFGQEPGGIPELPSADALTPAFEPVKEENADDAALSKRERPSLRIVRPDD